jgi:hypothetical protein
MDAPQAHHPVGSIEAMSKPPRDVLQPLLRDAEAELGRRLQEACEAESEGIENVSAREIRQLEDALLSAAAAAEHTLTLRRHIERHDAAGRPSDDPTIAGKVPSAPERVQDTASAPEAESSGVIATGLREFKDSAGQSWRAWAVTPGLSRMGRAKYVLGDFQLGWVCFENPASGARRRLPGHPERWSELNERELDVLLQQAITVRERHTARKDAADRKALGDTA